jgi:hypothetical protein
LSNIAVIMAAVSQRRGSSSPSSVNTTPTLSAAAAVIAAQSMEERVPSVPLYGPAARLKEFSNSSIFNDVSIPVPQGGHTLGVDATGCYAALGT